MSRTEVGSAYVSIYPDTSHFTDDLSKELGASSTVNAMSSAGEKAGEGFNSGFSAVTVALGNIMSNVIMGAVNLFTENLDRGIARLDTIQNFPRLMQTFGFSTDVAAESVQNIQEHLDGLPGSTDEVLRLVQAISDSTGSLELATSTGLAFNDMLTASGADAYTSMMAMRMFDQMMGGAQFTTMRWMALVSKMPLQMNMVAEEILGAGASAQELGNALQDGEVTMKDVAEAMTKLAPQFTVQARAFSYGIGTAMRNFGNRVALGIAAILDAIGQRRISGIINNISYGIRDALKFVADGVEWLRRVILTSGIGVLLGKIGDSIKEAFSNIDWEPLKEFIRNGLSALHDALQWIIDNSDIVKSLLVGIATAIGTLVVIDTVKNAIAGLSAIFAAIAATPMITVIAAITAGLVYFFTQTERGREMWASFMEVMSNVIDFLGDAVSVIVDGARVFLTALVQTVIDAASFIWNAAAGFIELVIGAVQGIWDFLGQAWDAGSQLFLIIAEFIGNTIAAIFDFVGAIVSKVMEVLGNVRSFTDWVIDGIIAVVAALVGAVAQAVGQLITDIGNTGAKIAEIWMNVKSTVSEVWGSIKSTVSNAVSNIKTNITNAFNSVKSTVSSVWGTIKSTITDSIGKARDAVKSAIDRIKSFFSFRIQWPHIPLPHFSISGSANPLDWLTGGLPKIGISWYAKGGFFDGASLIGVGEKGTELAWPSYSPYFEKYARGIAQYMEPSDVTTNNYYIDGSLVSADARLSSALDVVAECVSGRRRMGVS